MRRIMIATGRVDLVRVTWILAGNSRARDYVALEAASIIIHLAELFARHLRSLRSIFNFTFADRDRLTWLQIAFILGAFDGDK